MQDDFHSNSFHLSPSKKKREAWCDCLDRVVVGDDMYYCMSCAQIGETVFAVRRVQKRITVGIGTTRDTWHETGRLGFMTLDLELTVRK